ncbi:MAG: FliO/MopB family protein [Vicinamibacterales bacterium]
MIGWFVAAQVGGADPTLETGVDAVRVIGALLAVTGALVVFLWLLKRGTLKVGIGRGNRSGLAIESALSLGERRSLVIVAVEGRRLLLGLSPTHVSLVTELGKGPTFEHALDGAMGPREGQAS